MQTKRIIAYAAAFATSVSMLSFSASAASSKLKLLTAPLSDINNEAFDVSAMYDDDLYCTSDENGFVKSFFTVDMAAWKNSGEFSFKEVKLDDDVDRTGLGYNSFANILTSGKTSSDGDIKEYYAYIYDGGEINVTYSSENWTTINDDGYIISSDWGDGYAMVSVISPDGTTTELREDNLYSIASIYDSDKYVAALFVVANGRQSEKVDSLQEYDLEVALITKDGERESIYTDTFNYFGGISVVDGYVGFYTQSAPYAAQPHLFDLDTQTMYSMPNDGEFGYDPKLTHVTDDVFVDYHGVYGSDDYVYTLVKVDMKKDDTKCSFSILSDDYKYIADNGSVILVEDADDKWGYINTDGELLATFDDAGEFKGKYAPVVKDGKAFLINKDMKRVSEKIDADGVYTLDKDLFEVTVDDEVFLMTYAVEEKSAESDDTASSDDEQAGLVTDEPVDVPEKTGETPTDTAKDDSKANPDTGAASAAVVIGLTVAAGGVLMLSRKRR